MPHLRTGELEVVEEDGLDAVLLFELLGNGVHLIDGEIGKVDVVVGAVLHFLNGGAYLLLFLLGLAVFRIEDVHARDDFLVGHAGQDGQDAVFLLSSIHFGVEIQHGDFVFDAQLHRPVGQGGRFASLGPRTKHDEVSSLPTVGVVIELGPSDFQTGYLGRVVDTLLEDGFDVISHLVDFPDLLNVVQEGAHLLVVAADDFRWVQDFCSVGEDELLSGLADLMELVAGVGLFQFLREDVQVVVVHTGRCQ